MGWVLGISFRRETSCLVPVGSCFFFFVAVGVGTVGLSVIVRGGKAFEGNLVVGSARTTHTTKLQSTVVPTLYTLAVRSEGLGVLWVR